MQRVDFSDVRLIDKFLKAQRCIVVTGAGISDFRSEHGLYNLVKKQYPGIIVKGKDMFDSSILKNAETASLFYTFIAELKLLCHAAKATQTHNFIKYLHDEKKLTRCYTQNIDCLEKACGFNTSQLDSKLKKELKIVQLHGDLDTLVCTFCKTLSAFTEEIAFIFKNVKPLHNLQGTPIDCPACAQTCELRQLLGKRAITRGYLRPNIVLYNEPHPNGEIIGDFCAYDQNRKPDFLIVLGTSLKVDGIKRLVRDMAQAVRKNVKGCVVLVNKTEVSKDWQSIFDYFVMEDSDVVCNHLQKSLENSKKKIAAGKENKSRSNISKLPFKVVKKATFVSSKNEKTVVLPNKTEKCDSARVDLISDFMIKNSMAVGLA